MLLQQKKSNSVISYSQKTQKQIELYVNLIETILKLAPQLIADIDRHAQTHTHTHVALDIISVLPFSDYISFQGHGKSNCA